MAKKTEVVEKLEELSDVNVSVNEDLHQAAATMTLLEGSPLYDTTEDQWVHLVAGWAAGRAPNQQGAENVLKEAASFADMALALKKARFPSDG